MRTLITGHKGFIGRYLFDKLKGDGLSGIDLQEGDDLLNTEHFPKVDIVYHLAARTSVIDSVEDPEGDALHNIIATIKLCKAYPDTRIIFTSSGGAIQEKIESPYGLSKFCCEEYIKLLCKNYVICRLPNVYGTGSKSVVDKFINANELVLYNYGKNERTYVHVSDIVKGLLKAKEWRTGTYHLGHDKTTTTKQIAEATSKPYTETPPVPGELEISKVKNTTPNWKPEIDLMKYINSYFNY